MPERLGLPDVPDPRDETLVEQRVAELARRMLGPQVRDHPVELGRVGQDVRARAAACRAPRARAPGRSRAPPRDRRRAGRARAADPRRALLHDLPAAAHAQVAAQDEPALEAEQQVLADGLDTEQLAAVQPLCNAARRRRADAASRPRPARRRAPGACAPRDGGNRPRAWPGQANDEGAAWAPSSQVDQAAAARPGRVACRGCCGSCSSSAGSQGSGSGRS